MKRCISLMLALMILLACVGCGGQETSSTSDNGSSGHSSAEASETTAEDEDYPVLRFNIISNTGEPRSKQAEVMDAINEILREKAHAEIEPVWVNFAEMTQQMNLLLTGGDDSLDFYSSFWYQPLGTLVTNGQVIALDELIEEYGKETLALFEGYEDVLGCGEVDGQLYGIPSITAWSSPNFYFTKKSDSDTGQVDWSQVTDIDSLTTAMLAMKEANPEHYYIPGSTEPYLVPKAIDNLGDSNNLGVLTDPVNSSTIENYYESEYFLNLLENVKIWQENDLISPDPMSNTNPTLGSMRAGIVSGTTGYDWSIDEFVYKANQSMEYGEDIVGTEISPRYITTGNVTTYMWHISPFCEDPAAAMRVLNLLYTDEEVATLFAYGIEGVTYTLDEDGIASYMEGEDNISSGWNGGGGSNIVCNYTLAPTWDTSSPDMKEKMLQSNEEAQRSIALGFNCNTDPVSDQVAACANVVSQYYLPLINGVVDIDEVLPEFQKALHDAGIDDIIQYKQEQLDAWLAENGK